MEQSSPRRIKGSRFVRITLPLVCSPRQEEPHGWVIVAPNTHVDQPRTGVIHPAQVAKVQRAAAVDFEGVALANKVPALTRGGFVKWFRGCRVAWL